MRYLPGKDCGNCGHEGCMGFAKALGQGKVDVKRCPEMELRTRDSLKGALPIKLEVHGADSSMITVQETLIAVNSPMVSPPVLITGNCAVTLNMLKLIFDRAPEAAPGSYRPRPKGPPIDHAAGMKLMTPMSVMRGLMSSGVSTKVDRRDLIIPGLCAGAERQIEMMTKWKVKVGPRSGFELPLCLSKG